MSAPDTNQTLLIGFGNEWRGDDGIGPAVARRIEALGLSNVQVLVVHQLTPELAEVVSSVQRVFFVDACRERRADPVVIAPIMLDGSGSCDTHLVDPQAILTLSQLLYGRTPRAWLASIEGERFEPGDSLSTSANHHAETAVQKLAAMLS